MVRAGGRFPITLVLGPSVQLYVSAELPALPSRLWELKVSWALPGHGIAYQNKREPGGCKGVVGEPMKCGNFRLKNMKMCKYSVRFHASWDLYEPRTDLGAS